MTRTLNILGVSVGIILSAAVWRYYGHPHLLQYQSRAKGAVTLNSFPVLTNWLQSAEILLSRGSNIQQTADAMVGVISTNNPFRFQIVEALGWNIHQPHASVLLLRGLLKDKETAIRANALNMLVVQKAFAKPALNDVLQCTKDPDPNVRTNARYTMMWVFPEQGSIR